jgi:hypothetical protein
MVEAFLPVLEKELFFSGRQCCRGYEQGAQCCSHLQGDQEEDANPDNKSAAGTALKTFEAFR